MSGAAPPTAGPSPGGRPVVAAMTAALVGSAVLFATSSVLPAYLGYVVAGSGVGLTVALRARRRTATPAGAAVPTLLALGVIAGTSVVSPLADLFGAMSAIALLGWLAEDPARVPGGLGRSTPTFVLVLLTVGIAWTSALILPPSLSLVGVGGALLVLVVLLVAALLARPDLLDSEPAATA